MHFSTFTSLATLALSISGAIAAKSAGCGKSASLKSGNQANVQVNGKSRSWILKLPDNYDSNRAYKLILGIHWGAGSAREVDADNYYSTKQLSNNSAIYIAPNGSNTLWQNPGGEDITFIKGLMDKVEAELCVETTQRYAMGFSYGAAMTYSLTCSFGDHFRAVAIMSANVLAGCAGGGPKTPVATYIQHGISDDVLNISGGRAIRDTIAKANGCTAQNPPEPPRQNNGKWIQTEYQGCKEGYPLVWTAFDDTHWGTPKVNGVQWTPGEIWKFWSRFFDD